MPIRFRCVYCNQLLGIARRKAGTIVRCTSCQGQLIVPEPPPGEPDEPSATAPGNGTDGGTAAGTSDQPLFERNDFADLLQGFQQSAPSAVAAEPSVFLRDGDVIAPGYNEELDELMPKSHVTFAMNEVW